MVCSPRGNPVVTSSIQQQAMDSFTLPWKCRIVVGGYYGCRRGDGLCMQGWVLQTQWLKEACCFELGWMWACEKGSLLSVG